MNEITSVEPIDVQFKYVPEDFTGAFRLHFSRDLENKNYILMTIGLLVVGIVLSFLLGYSWYTAAPMYLCLVLEGILFFKFLTGTKAHFRDDPAFKESYFLRFIDDKIIFKLGNITVDLGWNHYFRYIENAQMYLLYFSKATFLIIPKRSFAKEVLPKFDLLLQQKVGRS